MNRPWLWWTLLAIGCWGVWALLAKIIGDALSPAHPQALSTLGLLPVMLALVLSKARNPSLRTRPGVGYALGAGTLTCFGNLAYYEVLNRGAKAATVVPLTAMHPLVTILLAVPLLGERLNGIQIGGVPGSLVALYLFNVQQDGGFLSPWLLVALIPVVLWGVAALLQKLSTNYLSGERSTLWFLGTFLPVAIWLLLREPLAAGLTWRNWLLAALLGFAFARGDFRAAHRLRPPRQSLRHRTPLRPLSPRQHPHRHRVSRRTGVASGNGRDRPRTPGRGGVGVGNAARKGAELMARTTSRTGSE